MAEAKKTAAFTCVKAAVIHNSLSGMLPGNLCAPVSETFFPLFGSREGVGAVGRC